MRNKYIPSDHTFAICAYKESPYLAMCITSVLQQNFQSNIIMITSTPSEYISNIAEKYGIKLYINDGERGIAGDWNFAYKTAGTKLVTITHQDDVYEKDYLESIISAFNRQKNPLIAFTDYGEIRDEKIILKNKLLSIKRAMLFPLKAACLQNSRFIRRRILSFGSPICCPSVTFVKENLPQPIFTSQYRSDVDWQAWEKISRQKGAFVYCDKILMYHRIHEESATTQIIADHDRGKEDFDMFCKFWPKPIAKLVERLYCKGEESNTLD